MIALAVSAAALVTNAVAADGKQAGGIDGTSVYSSNGTSCEIGGRAEARLSLKRWQSWRQTRVRLNFLGKVENPKTAHTVLVFTKANSQQRKRRLYW